MLMISLNLFLRLRMGDPLIDSKTKKYIRRNKLFLPSLTPWFKFPHCPQLIYM